MKTCPNGHGVTAAALMGASLLAVILFVPKAAFSQAGSDAKLPCIGCSVDGKTTPRTADGHPDLSGFWNGGGGGGGQFAQRAPNGSILYEFSVDFDEATKVCTPDDCPQQPNQPPYKTEYMAKVKAIGDTEYVGTTPLDPEFECLPHGIPRAGVRGVQILQTPRAIALLYEGAPSSIWRIIYTDGRPHPGDLDPSPMGDSIGHWEGDTLVVDVTGLSDDTWLGGTAHGHAKFTSIHSDQEHVVERWSRDGDVLTYQATVEDPVMFSKPWVLPPQKVHIAKASDAVLETICLAKDTDAAHMIKPTKEDPGQIQNGSAANAIKKK
jgi:hypothetical protein